MRKTAVLFLFFVLLFGCTTVTRFRPEKVPVQKRKRIPEFSTEVTVNYVAAEKNVFNNHEQPVIGILGFTDSGQDISGMAAQFYNELKYNPDFKIVSCNELKTHYELSRISATNSKLLSDIKKDFNADFVVVGKLINRTTNEFRISIMNLDSYNVIFEFVCKDSDESSAIQDAVYYFNNNKVPVYSKKQVRSGYTDSLYTVYEDKQIAYQEKRLDIPKVLGVIVLGAAAAYLLTKN